MLTVGFVWQIGYLQFKFMVHCTTGCHLLSILWVSARVVFAPGGVCSGGCLLPGDVCSREGEWYPSMHWGRHPPPVDRITDTSKNITLATTSLRPVNMKIWWLISSFTTEWLKMKYVFHWPSWGLRIFCAHLPKAQNFPNFQAFFVNIGKIIC